MSTKFRKNSVKEHPRSKQLLDENTRLEIENRRLKRELEEARKRITDLEEAQDEDPTELKEKIEELEEKVEYLEDELEAAREEADESVNTEYVEFVLSEIRDLVRRIEIIVQGGSSAAYHKIGYKQLLSILKEWAEELEKFINQD